MATESNTKETKIVRATPKKTDSQQEEQPRVTVKAAVKPQVRTQTCLLYTSGNEKHI